MWQILKSKLQYFCRLRLLPGGQARKKIWFRFRALKWRAIICSFGTTGNNQASTWKLPHFNFKKFRNVPRGAEVAGVFFSPAWFGKWSIVTVREESQLSQHVNETNHIVGQSSVPDKPFNYQNCAIECQRNLWNVKRWAWGHISFQLQTERTLIQIKRAGVVLFQDEAVWLTNLGTEASGISVATKEERWVIAFPVNCVNWMKKRHSIIYLFHFLLDVKGRMYKRGPDAIWFLFVRGE